MKKQVLRACVTAGVALWMGALVSGCEETRGDAGGSPDLFSKLGSGNVNNMANDLVGQSMRDPRLAGLTGGHTIDPAASSTKVSNQLCSMLGGGCQAPLSDTQMAEAAGRVTPEQSQAITEHFNSSLSSATQDPAMREQIREALGDKMPGVIGGLL